PRHVHPASFDVLAARESVLRRLRENSAVSGTRRRWSDGWRAWLLLSEPTQMGACFVGPAGLIVDFQIIGPRGARLVHERETLERECPIEQRFGEGGINRDGAIGGGQRLDQILGPVVAPGPREIRGGKVADKPRVGR